MKIAVLGCGIAGLAAAYALHRRGIDYAVFEATSRPGGVIDTREIEGYLIEAGPNSLQPKFDAVLDVLASLRIGDEMLEASPVSQNRYIAKDGIPQPLPMSPLAFVRSPLFSARAKIGLLGEPFRGRSGTEDESLASFVERRLGEEFLDYAVDPFVGGIYAARADQLSARHAFPKLFDLERLHGSLVRGTIRTARSRRKASAAGDWPPALKKRIVSFRSGLKTLVDAFSERISARVHLDNPVRSIKKVGEGWSIDVEGPGGGEHFDRVISTIPLHALPAIESEGLPSITALHEVYYAPVSIFHLGFEASSIQGTVDGFGMLVPSKEKVNILGALFSSSLFPGRAPEGHVLLTVFIGGARRPELCEMPGEKLLSLVLGDLKPLLRIIRDPSFVNRVDWAKAIPQYRPGYGRVKATLTAVERALPGLRFAGNYRSGVSVADALLSGWNAGLQVALPQSTPARIEPFRNPRNR